MNAAPRSTRSATTGGALHDRIAQSDAGDPVLPAKRQRDVFLQAFRKAVARLRVREALVDRAPARRGRRIRGSRHPTRRARAGRATVRPLAAGHARAAVPALAEHRLGRGHDDLSDRQPLVDDHFIQERRPNTIRHEEAAEVGEVILVCGEVEHRIDVPERADQRRPVGDRRPHPVDPGIHIRRPRSGVHRRFDESSTRDVVAACEQRVRRVRPDEPRAAKE